MKFTIAVLCFATSTVVALRRCPGLPYCPVDLKKSDSIFIPHDECNMYYICMYGKAKLMTCPRGLAWNQKKEACDFKYKVDCEQCVRDRPCAQPVCDKDDNRPLEPITLPSRNCSQFYICHSGTAFTMNCPDKLKFNLNTKLCDYPQFVDCNDCETADQKSRASKVEDVHQSIIVQQEEYPDNANEEQIKNEEERNKIAEEQNKREEELEKIAEEQNKNEEEQIKNEQELNKNEELIKNVEEQNKNDVELNKNVEELNKNEEGQNENED